MSQPKKPFNILDVFHIGYKKKTPEQLKYANFNRRMFAFTLDSVVLMLFVAPIVEYAYKTTYGDFPVNMNTLRQDLLAVPEEQRNQVFIQTMKDTGAFAYWLSNAVWQLIVFLILSGLCWRHWGATPGKIIMRIKIVDAKTEQPMSTQQILLRVFGYPMSATFFLLGFLWIGIDKRKRGWHDMLADTVVITLPFRKKKKAEVTPETEAVDP